MMTLDEFQPDYCTLPPLVALSVRESYYAHIAPVPALLDKKQSIQSLRARANAAFETLDDLAYPDNTLTRAVVYHSRQVIVQAYTREQLLQCVARAERAKELVDASV